MRRALRAERHELVVVEARPQCPAVERQHLDAVVPQLFVFACPTPSHELRLQLVDHEVVESKPDTRHWDLRMSTPFPALQALVDS